MKKQYLVLLTLFLLIVSCNNPSEPDYGDWPYIDNTGLTNRDNLTIVNGDTTITMSGTIVQNLDVRGTLTIQADDVTVRNCRVWIGSFWGIVVVAGYSGVLIEADPHSKPYVKLISEITRLSVSIRW